MSERADRPRIGRKGNKKVRTGCRTCKIRKVKCDETRPFCLRCTSSGRTCDGYPPVPPRARRTVPIRDDNSTDTSPDGAVDLDLDDVGDGNRQRSNTGGSSSSISSKSDSLTAGSSGSLTLFRNGPLGLPSPSPSLILGDSNGALALFHARTAPRLASYADHHFWHELLLQMGDVETAVRHALAAVNSIYDYCEGRGPNADPEPEQLRLQHPAYAHGLREYNRSISALMQRQGASGSGSGGSGGGDASVHLVCCVLFVCIEMLANERQAAMDHFDQGLKLLSSYTAGADDEPRSLFRKTDIVRETIAPIFRRLSLQAIMLGRETPLLPVFNQIYRSEDVRRASPFRSIQDASQALVAIMDDGLRLAHDIVGLDGGKNGVKYDPETWQTVRSMMEERRDAVRLDLEVWNDHFSPYAATWVTLSTDPKERLGCLLMRVQYMISIIWISTIAEEEESAFDPHLASFAQAIHYASEILMMQKVFPDPSTDTVFTFDMGVLAPMYFVCTKCRQRRIRRAALHLLNNWPRRENVWDPVQIAKVATRYIEIEDPVALKPDAPDDEWPPEWKRIHKVDFEVNKDENGIPTTIALMQRKPLGLDSQWEVIREVIPGLTINLGNAKSYHFTTK